MNFKISALFERKMDFAKGIAGKRHPVHPA